MRRNKILISNGLKDDLNRISTDICKYYAINFQQKMMDVTLYAINEFYNDYTPIIYRRHYYNFQTKSFRKYYKNPHNSIIRGGIELSPYFMDNLYGKNGDPETTNIVFDLVYTGWHGNFTKYGSEIPPMRPSPLEIIYSKKNEVIKDILNDKRWKNSINKERYNFLSL